MSAAPDSLGDREHDQGKQDPLVDVVDGEDQHDTRRSRLGKYLGVGIEEKQAQDKNARQGDHRRVE